jgi:hypothetical protein
VPAVSKAQFRWLHTANAEKALGKSGAQEWIGATGSPKSLPEKKKFSDKQEVINEPLDSSRNREDGEKGD